MQAYQLQYLQQMQMQYGLKVGLESYFIESRKDQLINNSSYFQSQDQEFLMLMQAQAQAQQHQQEVHLNQKRLKFKFCFSL